VTLTAGALIGFLSFLAPQQDARDLQPSIKKFTEDYYKAGAEVDDKINAVNYLVRHRHERIVRVLSPLLTEACVPVRIMVARGFGQFCGIEQAGRDLTIALQAQANSGKGQSAVRIEILRALGDLRYKPAIGGIVRMIEEKDGWVAKAAVDAASKVKTVDAIPPLIRALHRIEGRAGDAEITVNPLEDVLEGVDAGSLFKPDPREPKRPTLRQHLREPILNSLRKLTGQGYSAAKDWDGWWQKNKATFKITD
jgi:hypothetical protein